MGMALSEAENEPRSGEEREGNREMVNGGEEDGFLKAGNESANFP
jgi:hypothetical protein